MYGKGLRALSISTVVAITAALGLVFFYAPLEAEQGFLQKIFYVHVPLAIVALCGFVLGGAARDPAPAHAGLPLGHALLRGDPHEPDLCARDADHGLDLGEGLMGSLVGLERADAGVVPDHVPALRDLSAAAFRDRRPRAPGSLRVRVRDHGGGVRTDELHRRAAVERLSPPPRARQHLEPPGVDGVHVPRLAGGVRTAVRDPLQATS